MPEEEVKDIAKVEPEPELTVSVIFHMEDAVEIPSEILVKEFEALRTNFGNLAVMLLFTNGLILRKDKLVAIEPVIKNVSSIRIR